LILRRLTPPPAAIKIDIGRYFLHTRLPIRTQLGALSEQREPMSEFELPNTRYALSGDVNIAFQVMGDGPIDIILVPGIVSHVEFLHEFPGYTGFLRRLATFARVVTFDKRGQGLSDGISGAPSLEQRVDDVRAIMDDIGSQRAVLLGFSEGSPMSAFFAALSAIRLMIAISSGRMSCCSARLRSIASGLPSEGRKGWISWLWMMTGIVEGSLTQAFVLWRPKPAKANINFSSTAHCCKSQIRQWASFRLRSDVAKSRFRKGAHSHRPTEVSTAPCS
jgi:pimeloyl-ACP methyl ester carboxylesterase